MKTEPAVGADMALRTFTAALRWDARRCLIKEFANSPAGFRAFLRWLHQHFAGGVRVGVESTNTYGEGLAEAAHAAGHRIHLLNPERVACHVRASGLGNKTDPADAKAIAAFVAQHEDLTVWQPPSPQQKALRSLTRARSQLVQALGQLANQLRTASGPGREHLAAAHRSLQAQLTKIGREIARFVQTESVLREGVRRLKTLKGIGLVTAATLLAELPPITSEADSRAICHWAGLTPRRRQSGRTEWPARLGRAGNAYLRQALYMPALVAKRWNPCLAAFAERLKAKGKTTPAILGAISHKMLRIAVGMLKSNSDFDANWSLEKT